MNSLPMSFTYIFNYLMCELLEFKEQCHEYSHLYPFRLKTWMSKRGGRGCQWKHFFFFSFLFLWFIFIPNNYLAWYLVYQGSTMSANSLLMHDVSLTFMEEAGGDISSHNPPWARGSLLFPPSPLTHNTVVFNLISFHCVTAPRFLGLWILQ